MNIRAYLFTVFFCAAGHVLSQPVSDLAEYKADELLNLVASRETSMRELCQTLRALPADKRAQIAEKLNRRYRGEEPGSSRGDLQYVPLLVAVGDQEIIRKFTGGNGRELNSNTLYAFEQSGNPAVVGAIGDRLLDENARYGQPTAPCFAWRVIRAIILLAPEFTRELKTWAESTYEGVEPDGADGHGQAEIAVLRQWWKENRAACQAGQFSQVKPGAAWPVWNSAQRIQDAAKPAPKPGVSMPMKPQQVSPAPKSAPPGDENPSGNAYVWTGIAVLTAAGASWALHRLKRKNG